MRYIDSLSRRMPDRGMVLGVYSVLVSLLYSWTLFNSFFVLPSWIYSFDVLQIVSIYAYSFLLNFVESIFFLMIVLLLEPVWIVILGASREDFRPRAVMYTTLLISASAIRLYELKTYEDMAKFLDGELRWWICVFLIAMMMGLLAPRIAWLRVLLDGFADRAFIFLYIYLPLSLISLFIVLMRNIF